jgi:regulatory protein YycH of two-component signal transduction system YycFG
MMTLLIMLLAILAVLSLVYLWFVFKSDEKFDQGSSMSRNDHIISAIVTFLVAILCIAFCLGGF